MESYKNHTIIFNEEFFNSLRERWLNGIEIYLLLNNAEQLIKNNFIELYNSNKIHNDSISEDTKNKPSYFLASYNEYSDISKEKNFDKTRYYNIKIQSIDKIKVINSTSKYEQRRIYYLLENPKYIFIHYRYFELQNNNKINNILLDNININTTPINIINFNPDSIEEDTEDKKLFIIIKSKFTSKDLNNLKPYLSISFGNKFVKYEVISDNVLSCYIPPQKKKEVIIDIYFSNESNKFMNKISTYEQKNKKSFCYTSNKTIANNNKTEKEKNNFENYNINKEIDKFKIFNYGIREIISRVISLFNYFMTHINFYIEEEQKNNEINNNSTTESGDNNNINSANNNININNNPKNKIDISLIQNNSKIEGGGFYEINVNTLLEKIIIELKKLNKIELINYCDEDGYNLLHYLSVLNFSKSLILLNNNNLDFTEKSKDNLTVYEICAGKKNLDSLLTIIEIMETKDNEKEKNWYDMDVYKSALFLFLEKQESDFDDVQILNALLKQIKIKYIIDSTSGKIIDNVNMNNKGEEIFINSYTRRNVRKIQKAVKSWLKRNKYKSLQKNADSLIEKIKESCEGKKFSKAKLSAIFIQKEIRKWLKEKHKNKNKE